MGYPVCICKNVNDGRSLFHAAKEKVISILMIKIMFDVCIDSRIWI